MQLQNIYVRPEVLVAMLRKEGVEGVSVDLVRAHIAAGCPVTPDGLIDLWAYLAWLLEDILEPDQSAGNAAS